MATTITIPLGNDPFECTVNGVYHSYAAGTTVEVPDEVAALIQSIEGNDPPKTIPAPPVMPRGGSAGQVLTRTDCGAEWVDIPAMPAATESAIGGVKMTAYVEDVASDADAAAVRTGLIALIEALKDAGIVSDEEPET